MSLRLENAITGGVRKAMQLIFYDWPDKGMYERRSAAMLIHQTKHNNM